MQPVSLGTLPCSFPSLPPTTVTIVTPSAHQAHVHTHARSCKHSQTNGNSVVDYLLSRKKRTLTDAHEYMLDPHNGGTTSGKVQKRVLASSKDMDRVKQETDALMLNNARLERQRDTTIAELDRAKEEIQAAHRELREKENDIAEAKKELHEAHKFVEKLKKQLKVT